MLPAVPWAAPAIPARTRALAALFAVGFVLAAAWVLPPLLDWGRFRTQIAAIASARLGRPVSIGGDIALRLLPQAVLTASDVTLGQGNGDGISVQVRALRLQVATLPLLLGDLRLHDLVLSAPVLNLPLILPAGIAHPSRPLAPHPFAARIENGTLRVGRTEITGISASIHGGPALPSVQGSLATGDAPVAAFGTEGFATIAGLTWRFTGALGAPDADGVSAVDLSVHGQGAAADTAASIQATLDEGVLQGRLHAGGSDLSVLMPASPLAWRADAPFVATVSRVEAGAIGLSLGGAPAEGALALQLDAPARLDGRLHAASLDLDGWAALLGRTFVLPNTAAGLPRLHVALTADTARLLGGVLHDARAALVSDGQAVGFDQAQAILPGDAVLTVPQARFTVADAQGRPAPLALSGRASLDAPDLRKTLTWLGRLAPALADGLPQGVMKAAKLSGQVALSRSGLTLAGLSGTLDGAAIAGTVTLGLAPLPRLDATLDLADLALDDWVGAAGRAGLADLAGRFAGAEAELHITASQASLFGLHLQAASLSAHTGRQGVQLHALTGRIGGGDLAISFSAGPDGRITDGRGRLGAPDLARLAGALPPAVRRWAPGFWTSGLWAGPGGVVLAASGPADALSLQLRADAGDLVLEAEALGDVRAGTGTATLTLRHPGAPRLLSTLGLAGGMQAAADWLDTGSLTLRTHLMLRPGHLDVQDFDLDAAALRVGGHLQADWSAGAPRLTGSIEAEQLALPAAWPAGGWTLPPAWTSSLHVSARMVLWGLQPVAQAASAEIATAGPGILASGVQADVLGGHARGEIAGDLSGRTAALRAGFTAIRLDWPVPEAPFLSVVPGTIDGDLDLLAQAGLAGLSGQADMRLLDAKADGFDLALLARAAVLRGRAGRALVQKALTQGETAALSGDLHAVITPEAITLAPALLKNQDGSISLAAAEDRLHGQVSGRLGLTPVATGMAGAAAKVFWLSFPKTAVASPAHASRPLHASR